MKDDVVIKTDALCKSYALGKEAVSVLHDIDFEIRKGEYVAIMGQSGAGKSTLLNILACLDVPTSGQYFFCGNNINTLSDSMLADIRNQRIGFVFQNFNLLPKLNIFANVELPLIYSNTARKKRKRDVEAVLKRFGLWERRSHKPNEISGGQKQRVAIARALVKKPAIIFADEPTGNLDSSTTEDILKVFDELSLEGHTLIVITHESMVADKAQRIIRLVDGRIVS